MITQITKKIALCETTDVTEENLEKWKIDCVLNVNEVESPHQRVGVEPERLLCQRLKIHYLWVPCGGAKGIANFINSLETAAETLEKLVTSYSRVLVHCLNSIDKAPYVVALYLSNVAYLTLPQAYSIVKQQRKHITEHYEWNSEASPL